MTSTSLSIVTVAVALIVVVGTVAGYFYYNYSNEVTLQSNLERELTALNANYTALASGYNNLLSKYNETLSLLSQSIALINTSSPVYVQASKELASLWQTYLALKPASVTVLKNNVLIDFGNGTRAWHNNTAVQPGWNLYIETLVLADGNVVAKWYPQYQAHFVTGIGGVSNSRSAFWFIWTYNKTASWQEAQAGADQLVAYDGSVYAWTFCTTDQNFKPVGPCRP